ncbi:MAG: hypothetical protein FJ090_11665 [Deltaproteobacteria bacterium]|nr:hypothetical protein [Deltaproteobacteria bacterium]
MWAERVRFQCTPEVTAMVAWAALLGGCDGLDYGFQDPDVTAPPEVWVEETLVQATAPPVDVLFVVDGTGSMEEEQEALAAASADFVDALVASGLEWQVGATSSDPVDAGSLQGRPWILTPLHAEAGAELADALAVGTSHAPPSAGLDSAALALADAEGENVGFRRDGAALHVVFVSDGDDESGSVLGADAATSFVSRLAEEAAETGQPASASAVVGDAPSGCDGGTGEAQVGTRYIAVAEATGGSVSSICALDFSGVADALGTLAVNWPTRFSLQATPVDGSVSVLVNGQRETSFSVDEAGPALIFASAPPPEAVIEVRYQLAGGA